MNIREPLNRGNTGSCGGSLRGDHLYLWWRLKSLSRWSTPIPNPVLKKNIRRVMKCVVHKINYVEQVLFSKCFMIQFHTIILAKHKRLL